MRGQLASAPPGLAIDRDAPTPWLRQVHAALSKVILDRQLPPGTRLPATRSLATQLGLTRTAIVAAYEQLLAEGYTTGRIGSGTYVSTDLPDTPRGRIAAPVSTIRHARPSLPRLGGEVDVTHQNDARPFNLGRTLVDARTMDIWRRLSARTLRSLSPGHLDYGDPRGTPELRLALAAHRAVRCDPDQIIVTSGTPSISWRACCCRPAALPGSRIPTTL